MDQLAAQILDYLQRPNYKPKKAKELAKKLGIKKKHQAELYLELEKLLTAGKIRQAKNGMLRPQTDSELIAGIIRRTSRGTGYLIPHEKVEGAGEKEPDVFINERDLLDAHTGDEVLIRLKKRRRHGGQRCGQVAEILERATHMFVGTYLERNAQGFVQVDGTTFNEPVFVGDPGAKGAVPDDKVVIEMLRFPSHSRSGEAVLTRVLGQRGDPGIDTLTIIHEFGLPEEFPEEVLEEARIQAEQFDEAQLNERLDLTDETIVTIDPADARDFDDAISLKRTEENHWQLGVHIADVSWFVQPDTALDREAKRRGNSVYLPGKVLAMLPEIISNGLASLQQGRVRYAKSLFIEFNPDGIPLHTAFANSAIKVTRRFAYEQVMPIVQQPGNYKKRVDAKVRLLLAGMYELAMLLRKRRFEAGALELNLPEIKIEFDRQGKVAGAHQAAHDASHQIIEEFMLAANIAVAQQLTDREVAFMRRAHSDPNYSKLESFAQFVDTLGFRLKNFQSRPGLQNLLERVKGTLLERAVNYGLLRSMQAAEYTGQEIGHYALGIENYCHFTSPIRRFPDLIMHRLIDAIARGKKKVRGPNEGEITKLGKQCSLTERRAERAERELIRVKLLTFMETRIGQEMDAVITGVERFGLFCQGLELPVDGLVHISWLTNDDHYYYDSTTFSIVGRRTGRQYRLGDQVRVEISHVDVDRRQLDFRLVIEHRQSPSPAKKAQQRSNKKRTPKRTAQTGKPRTAQSKKNTNKKTKKKKPPRKKR